MKKILYSLLTLAMGFVLSGSGCDNGPDPIPDGSEGRPFIITNAAELDNIRNELTKHYKLGGNIDLSGYLATGGGGNLKWGTAGWLPIGTGTARFKGSLDGAGYAITGLWINRTTTGDVGLFGCLDDGATLKNLGVAITSAGVKGQNNVGGLAGYIFEGVSITHCYATGAVSGTSYVGGVVGHNTGSITHCYTTGAVSGTNYVGGLVGYISGSSANITHCYATGTVSGTNYVGGVVGFDGTPSPTIRIRNCVALNPSVRATGSDVGRVVGGYTLFEGLANNWANSAMGVNGGIALPSGNGLTHVNGASVSSGTAAGQYNNAAWWTSTGANGPGWSSTIWTFTTGTGQLPKLR